MPRPPWFIRICGGRKFFNGYVGVVLLTVMVFPLDGDFQTWSMMVCLLLGFTAGTQAWEDRAKHQNGKIDTDIPEAS